MIEGSVTTRPTGWSCGFTLLAISNETANNTPPQLTASLVTDLRHITALTVESPSELSVRLIGDLATRWAYIWSQLPVPPIPWRAEHRSLRPRLLWPSKPSTGVCALPLLEKANDHYLQETELRVSLRGRPCRTELLSHRMIRTISGARSRLSSISFLFTYLAWLMVSFRVFRASQLETNCLPTRLASMV